MCIRSCIRCLFRLRFRAKKWPYRISSSTFLEDLQRVPYSVWSEEKMLTRQIKRCGKAKMHEEKAATSKRKLSAEDRKLFFSLMLKKREVNPFSHWNEYESVDGVLIMRGKYRRRPCITLP